MPMKKENRFSSQNICKILVAARLISADQARDILKKENRVKQVLIKNKRSKANENLTPAQLAETISFIDVLVYLKIEQLGKPQIRLMRISYTEPWQEPGKCRLKRLIH